MYICDFKLNGFCAFPIPFYNGLIVRTTYHYSFCQVEKNSLNPAILEFKLSFASVNRNFLFTNHRFLKIFKIRRTRQLHFLNKVGSTVAFSIGVLVLILPEYPGPFEIYHIRLNVSPFRR